MKNKLNPIQKNLIILVTFCLLLLLIRMKITHSIFYGFLIWNIFLASVPLIISKQIIRINIKEISKFKLKFLVFVWLIFLPNAPYIITDFIHLHHSKSVLIWLDIFLLFSFSCTGLLFTVISLNDIFKIIKQKWNFKIANIFITSAIFLCGFGIYLGRFIRLNSWDIITSPFTVLKNSIYSFSDLNTWLVTFGFGSFIWILFSVFKSFKKTNNAF